MSHLLKGWQEPGFWRCKWIMEREFDDEEDEKKYPTRIAFKMKQDKSIQIFREERRPKFEWFKKKKESEKKRKLFETGDEKVLTKQEQFRLARKDKANVVIDGAWSWADAAPLNQGKVTIETLEADEEKIRHDCRCDWGKLDGYAPLFRQGKIIKYKLTPQGIPIGTFVAGTFNIKVSPHRPIVSKDFLAFQ